jgi:hypothetical protein
MRLMGVYLAGVITAVIAMALIEPLAAQIPRDPAEAHRYADGVLIPRLTAALNEFVYRHPQDPENRPWAHCERLDAGDVARWREVIEAAKAADKAYKRAGY